MILGIDIGTTSVKAVALRPDGSLVGHAEHAHDLSTPHPGWAEEDPEAWWTGVVRTVSQIARSRDLQHVRALGISGMVPALILLDDHGRPLRPSIQQNDVRAVEEIRELAERYPEDELFRRTGATWNQQVLPPKLLWVRRREPEVWSKLARLSGSYEYITYRLTESIYVEANWALESGMYDAIAESWLAPVLSLVDLDPRCLAPIRRPHEVVGEVTARAADVTGLPVGTPVIAGSADHIAAAVAAGLVAEGDVVLKFGGAGDFLYTISAFRPLRELFIDYHDLPGMFVINGCMATSGSLVKWFRAHFAFGVSYSELDARAASVPPGSDGVVILPYFLGEKTPLHDPLARGTILGLTLSHTPAHLYRAILEAVAYAFRHHVEILERAGHAVGNIYVMDGGARSPLWRGITASVLNREVVYLEGGHLGSAYGVAWVAGVTAGLWSWQNIRSRIRVADITPPDPIAVRRYHDLYEVFRESYKRLKDLYPRLRGGHAERA